MDPQAEGFGELFGMAAVPAERSLRARGLGESGKTVERRAIDPPTRLSARLVLISVVVRGQTAAPSAARRGEALVQRGHQLMIVLVLVLNSI